MKPQNTLLTQDFRIKLADFGISRIVNPNMNDFAKKQIETPYFMAPEILKKQPYSFSGYIWSFGCIRY
jgi:serine/threonine protein kinase